jgi:hypothetical protein
VLRREGGVVQDAALIDEGVNRGLVHGGGTQKEEIGQEPIMLVNGRRAGVAGHHCFGLARRDGVRGQDVRRQQVVEHAIGIGKGPAAARRRCPLDPAHEHLNIGLVDGHPMPAVRCQCRQHPLHVGHKSVR